MLIETFGDDFSSVYEEFCTEIPSLVESLKQLVNSGDAGATARMAHQIKGASANFGFAGVSQAAAALDVEAKGGSLAGAQGYIAEMEDCFKRSIDEVRASR